MQVDAATPLSEITIQNLTFCGGTYPGNPKPSSFCAAAYQASGLGNPQGQTTCGQWTQQNTISGSSPEICMDLEIDHADTGQNPANPFTYMGPYSVTINNVDLEDAGGHALALFGSEYTGKRVNDIYINGSAVNSSGVTGILMGATSPNALNFKVCDAKPNFANTTDIYLPRNIRIENNTFQNNSTGAVGAWARWVGLRNNTFSSNYINWQGAGDGAGGGVVFDQCADTIEISGNTVVGPDKDPNTRVYPLTLGFELWGRNITVIGNNISNEPQDAIGVEAVLGATITGNTVTNNDQVRTTNPSEAGLRAGGITLSTFGAPVCGQIPRDSKNITITNNTSSGQPYGVSFMDRGLSRNIVQDVTIDSSNNLSGNTYYPIAVVNPIVGLTNVVTPPGEDPTVAGATSETPRALAPDAVSPGASLCPAVGGGSDRQTFTFSASDVDGPSAIETIEARFVTTQGNPGDTAGGCDLIFQYIPASGSGPPVNVVTLITDSVPWPQSVVGSGGADLVGGNCTVHAGSSASHVMADAKTANVTLDISFKPSLGTRYIYTWVTNTQGQFSNGGNWQYWGWWLIP
jgi:hypothetical protein